MRGGLSRDRSNVKALRGLAFPVWLNSEPDWAVATGHEPVEINTAVCVRVADMYYQVAPTVTAGLFSQRGNDLLAASLHSHQRALPAAGAIMSTFFLHAGILNMFAKVL